MLILALEMEVVIRESLTEKHLNDLVSAAKDFVFSHGVIMRRRDGPSSPDHVQHAPFTLFPSSIPRVCFDQAVAVHTDFNLLMHRIAHDRAFLADCLKSVIRVDDFTKSIWEIYETVQSEGVRQPLCLSMNRSDYMIDCRSTSSPDGSNQTTVHRNVALRQIEFNTMAASFAGLSQKLHLYHKFILGLIGSEDKMSQIPVNNSADGLAEGLAAAWTHYGNPNAVILFLTYNDERNIYDHRWLEYSVYDIDVHIKVIRKSMMDVEQSGRLSTDHCLFVDDLEVAVVYQRSCYVPADFDTEESWKCRLMMERSKAIVCPNAGYHLAGTKKVQQVLAQPGVVERFITDKCAAERIRATFAEQFSLDMNEEGDRNLTMALNNPQRFVLKPQREGGGNNTYGDEIKTLLTTIRDSEERSSYVLMERIEPLTVSGYPISPGMPVELTQMISELGIYGTLVGTKDKIFLNKQTGYLLRTKKVGTNEGGVATGYSVLDSPFLID